MPITFPPGFKPGLLPRRTLPGGRVTATGEQLWPLADEHEAIDIKPAREWARFITIEEARERRPWMLYQDGRGSCAMETLAAGVGYLQNRQGGRCQKTNPWPGYRFVSGGQDRGSSIGDCLRWAREHGFPSQDDWPRYDENGRIVHDWDARVPERIMQLGLSNRLDEFAEAISGEHVGSMLDDGIPCAVGLKSHAVLAVGLKDRNKAICWNWWRYGWGNADWHELPYGLLEIDLAAINFNYEAFGLLSATLAE